MDADRESFVAECFWPGVTESDLEALERRVHAAVAASRGDGGVRYLGSILMLDDEVVLCQFQGSAETVHEVAERAEIPFERILVAVHSPWPVSGDGGRDDS